jgi:hypothetical protein
MSRLLSIATFLSACLLAAPIAHAQHAPQRSGVATHTSLVARGATRVRALGNALRRGYERSHHAIAYGAIAAAAVATTNGAYAANALQESGHPVLAATTLVTSFTTVPGAARVATRHFARADARAAARRAER